MSKTESKAMRSLGTTVADITVPTFSYEKATHPFEIGALCIIHKWLTANLRCLEGISYHIDKRGTIKINVSQDDLPKISFGLPRTRYCLCDEAELFANLRAAVNASIIRNFYT